MTHQHKLALAGKTAVVAALMSGSSLVWAQDATAPAAPAPTPAAEATFAPPPVVRTMPTENDVVNPAAAEQAPDTVAFADDSVAEQDATTGEDVTLIGGMAAALAALGIGAAFFARRRRKPADVDRVTPVDAAPAFVAPQPIREASVFKQFDRTPAPQAIAPRMPIQGRSDIPVTDPLFSTPVVAGPITDPLFAPRNAVEPPITDPLFANHDRFTGRARHQSDIEPRKPALVS